MILLIIIPVYISLNLYILHRVHKWLTACSERFHSRKFAVIFIAVADILRLVLKKIPGKIHDFFFSKVGYVFVGILLTALIGGISAYGIVHSNIVKVKPYEVTIRKNCGDNRDLKVVLVAGIKSRYGSFGVFGNHDVTERLLGGFSVASQAKEMRDPRFEEFAKKAKIRILDDEVMLIDDAFYLVGRKDAQKPGDGTKNRIEPEVILSGLDKAKPIIVLEHQPKQLEELERAGADMQLCGHTHDGQMFPGNLTVKLMWENACGYLKKGNLHSIVTSGVGVWGPAMRVGTDCEICPITIHFQG